MFSVLMLAGGSVPAAARSLAALVPAAVEGAVGRVILWAPAETDELALLAAEAGCEPMLGATIETALDAVRKSRRDAAMLILSAGAIVPPGWVEEAIRWRQDAQSEGAAMVGPEVLARWRVRFGRASTRRAILLATPEAALGAEGGHVHMRKRPTILAGRFSR